MWPLHDIHAILLDSLRAAAVALDEEQAVRGLDARSEVELHPLLAEALVQAGFGVAREVRYPGDRRRSRRSEGRRCDLVVTPEGLPLDEDAVQPSLLGPRRCPLHEALWIEVKVVAQFGEEQARSSYGAALQGPIWRDLAKLGADPAVEPPVEHAAQLVVLFTATAEVAAHDLAVSLDRAWSRGLRLGTPITGHFPIVDRFGNGSCTAALVRIAR